MAKIVKIGKMWYSDYTQDNRRIKRALSPYKEVAQCLLDDLLKLRKSDKDGTQPTEISWFYFRERYLKHCKTEKDAHTYYQDRHAIEMIEKYGRPLTRLSQMTPAYMKDLKEKCAAKGIPEKTVLGWLRRIKTAMHWARAWELAPMQDWSLIQTATETKEVTHMDHEAFLKTLATCKDHWKTAAMLMGYGGLRSGEVRHLEWKDVDFKQHLIRIRSKVVQKPAGETVVWKPKGTKPQKNKNRVVDLPKILENYLQSLPGRSGYVLGSLIKKYTYRQYFQRIAKKVKFKVTAHMYRHSYASFLISSGSTLPEVGSLLGHSDARSTQVYAHMLPHARRNAVDRMETGLNNGSTGLGAQ